MLFVVVQAAAAAKSSHHSTTPGLATPHRQPVSLEARLHRELAVETKARRTVRFFETHRRRLRYGTHHVVARKTLVRARRRLDSAEIEIARLRHAIRQREIRRLEGAPPRRAICDVFRENCQAAVDVAWCESRLQTTARNGEYLGLFQMGTLARRLFGHGPTAWEQARAAHEYFVYSGRDWSPWSCKPLHGYS